MNSEIAKLAEKIAELSAKLAEMVKDEPPPTVPKEALEKAAKGLCTYCADPLDSGRIFRGAHERCYKRINRAIHAGEITEQQAVSRGYMLLGEKGGRPADPNDPITASKAPPSAPKRKTKRPNQ